MIRRGLDRLVRFAPELVIATFPVTPTALVQTAALVAAISPESAQRLLVAYSRSALGARGFAEAGVERLCEQVAPIARAGGPNPIRRALRRHLCGEVTLSEAQLRGHRERVVANLGIVRLAAIRQATERVLAARVGIDTIETASVRHAVAVLGNAEANRRQFRRMLAASLSGDREWRLRHPRTVEWFARHPKLDRDVWLHGIATRGEVPEIGEVRIAIETDPLEAVKLGTYVGSCLGRGGSFEFSAAAVVLDVNKQVVYARDRRGSVIGRQLLAISECDQLVCFSVYATASIELLEPLFRDYDRWFACQLGIPLFDGAGSAKDYEIAMILSRDWWDDHAWHDVAR